MSTTGTSAQRKEWYSEWYSDPENKKRQIENSARHKKKAIDRNKQFVIDYKLCHPCEVCGESRTHCLDFHHNGQDKKEKAIALGVLAGWSVQHLRNEMGKCTVLCRNCHADFHYREKTGQ